MESFLVLQLKKQNRSMKIEIQEKDRFIEELKRNIRLSRQNEGDTELQVYMDECMRLRSLLEQTMIQNDALTSQ